MHRAAGLLGLLVLVLVGCGNDPTPAGTEVFSVDTSEDVPRDARDSLGAPVSHEESLPLTDDGGRITVAFETAATPEGGRYVLRIAVTVDDAAGYTVGAGAPGNPVNMGTVEAPVHERLISVSGYRESLTGRTSFTTLIEVRADGTVERR